MNTTSVAVPATGRALVPTMLSLVRFSHTVFALPFAAAAALLAADGLPRWTTIVWILLAMVGARTLAMALNRVLDADIDAANPRTAARELPSGQVRPSQVWGLAAISVVALLVAVSQLPRITWVLWPIPVAMFVLYPLAKRVTWACHLVLGVTIGIAPLGAWIAVTGALPATPVLIGAAVACWIAGFDIIYALLDIDFDRGHGIHSIPARFGEARALWFTRTLHLLAIVGLAGAGLTGDVHGVYFIGVGVCAVVLAVENTIVRPGETARVQVAFAHANATLAIVYLAFVALAVAL